MIAPALCAHNEAVYNFRGGRWGRACPACGLEAWAPTFEPTIDLARARFASAAERTRVSRLLERRAAGEVLSSTERAEVAYSPFGDGISFPCGG